MTRAAVRASAGLSTEDVARGPTQAVQGLLSGWIGPKQARRCSLRPPHIPTRHHETCPANADRAVQTLKPGAIFRPGLAAHQGTECLHSEPACCSVVLTTKNNDYDTPGKVSDETAGPLDHIGSGGK